MKIGQYLAKIWFFLGHPVNRKTFLPARRHSAVLAVVVSVRPSLRPSQVCSTKTAKDRITQTIPYDGQDNGLVVFWYQDRRNSNEVIPNWGARSRWHRLKSSFDKSVCNWNTIQNSVRKRRNFVCALSTLPMTFWVTPNHPNYPISYIQRCLSCCGNGWNGEVSKAGWWRWRQASTASGEPKTGNSIKSILIDYSGSLFYFKPLQISRKLILVLTNFILMF